MKKQIAAITSALVLGFSSSVLASETGFYLNNMYIENEGGGYTDESVYFIPLRTVAEGLGCNVSWESPYAIINYGQSEIKISSESTSVTNGNNTAILSKSPYIKDGKMMVSVLDLEKILNCKTEYDSDGNLKIWSDFTDTKSYMKDIKAIAYCNSEEYVYYITFGDLEGIHRMLSDGSEDILIRNLDGIDITANTSVTMEYKGTSIIFIMQELSQTDENGIAEKEYPVYKYELNLADNSLKKL